MLIKILSSESQLIQKVSPKLSVVKLCSFVLVFSILFSFSAFAYTETQDGLKTIYEWEFSGVSTVAPLIIRKNPDAPITPPTAHTPTMRLQARHKTGVFYNATNSTFKDTSKRIGTISNRGDLGNSLFIYSTGLPGTFDNGNYFESNIAVVTMKTGIDTLTMTDSYYTFSVDFSTIFDFFASESLAATYDERLEIFTSACRVYLLNDYEIVASLSPSYMSFNEGGVTIQNGDGFTESKGDVRYYERCSVEFLIRSEVESLEIDSIQFSFPCMVGTSVTGLTQELDCYFWLQSLGFSNPRMEVITTKQYDEMLVANYQNDNLIKQLSVVNSIDAESINNQSSQNDKLESEVGKLDEVTDLSNNLNSSFDVETDVDILTNDDFLGTIEDIWDIFPWDSSFFVSAIGMVGGISVLSLILHAGERGISLSIGGGHSKSKSSQSKSNNKNGGDT